MSNENKKNDEGMKIFWRQFMYWAGGLIGGPGVSIILQKWVITDPSEWLVALIYGLGFAVYFFAIFLNYRLRIAQIELLKYMVHTREETKNPDGVVVVKDYGRIDENSVNFAEKLRKLI